MDLLLNHVDFTKTPKEILLAAISKINGYTFNAKDFNIGTPQIVEVTAPDGKKLNTAIELSPSASARFKGKTTVYYNRIDMASIGLIDPYLIPAGEYARISDLLPVLNQHFNIVINKEDILDDVIPVFPGTDPTATVPIVFTANSLSILFTGRVTFQLERPDVDINALITKRYLDDIRFDY